MKPRKTKRSQPKAGARLRPFWLLMLALVLALGAGAFWALSLPIFRPKTLAVSGNDVVPSSAVLDRAAIDPRQNMWLQDSAAIEKRVEGIPYVNTVHLERAIGAETIVVTERVPYAIAGETKRRWLVDRTLRVLEPAPPDSMLPWLRAPILDSPAAGAFLTDAGLPALRDDNDALAAAKLAVASLEHDRYGDLVVVLRNGVRVLFGDEAELAKKIPLVQPILDQVGRAGRPIAAIDLRAETTPIVVYKHL
jgi:cell division septal protein FtsQ